MIGALLALAAAAAAPPAGTDLTCAGAADRAEGSEVDLHGGRSVAGHIRISGPYAAGRFPFLLLGYPKADGTQVHVRFDNNLPRRADGTPVAEAGVRIEQVGADSRTVLAASPQGYVDLEDADFEIVFGDGRIELATTARILGVGERRRETISLAGPFQPPARLSMMCFGATYAVTGLNHPFPPPAFDPPPAEAH